MRPPPRADPHQGGDQGKEAEADFDFTTQETIETIHKAKGNSKIPFSVFKVTGVARFELLSKVNDNLTLTTEEQTEFEKVKAKEIKVNEDGVEEEV